MVNGCKPDVSHLHIFSLRCWARIPTELQTKFGPHSRRAIFMGYPDGVKGYQVHDPTTGAFFIAHNVKFNEELPAIADSDSNDDEDNTTTSMLSANSPVVPIPTAAENLTTSSQITPAPIPEPPRHSTRTSKLTVKGAAWVAELAATKARLQTLQKHQKAIVDGIQSEGAPKLSKGVSLEEVNDLKPIEENNAVPEAVANVVIEEQAHITIRSNKRHNPLVPDYDMGIPPATYEEAMQQSDRDEWLAAMNKELQTMKDMGVYKVAKLPEG